MIHLLILTLFPFLCKGKCTCTSHPSSQFVSYSHLSLALRAFTLSLSFVVVPKSVQETLSIPSWKAAMDEKMSALSQNATWSLVPSPPGKTTVGCHLVFTMKYLPNFSIERLKASVVAKGYT